MAYRDDREQLIARTEELETELVTAREEIARLRGGRARSNGFVGAPTRIEVERELPGEIPESAIEDLVVELRARFGVTGRVDRLGHTISWSTDVSPRGNGRRVAIHFTMRDGQTRVRIEEALGQLAGGLFGGIVGGAGGAGSVNLLVWGFILGNVLMVVGGVAWLALVYGIVRAAYGAVARNRERALEGLGSEIEERLRHAAKDKKVRVSDESEAEDEADVEDEEEAEEPPARAVKRT